MRLFGQGRIEERKDPNSRHQFKKFIADESNPFQFLVQLMGAKKPPGYGNLTIGDYKRALPFDHELIEKHLMPGVQGSDPLHPLKPMTNEARNLAGGRPLANHHKGYWKYAQTNKTEDLLVDIDVALDRNAQVLQIDLTQQEK